MSAIEQFIDNEVKTNDVVLFMKGTPVFPQCGFSAVTVQVLSRLGLKFKGIDILSEPAIRTHLKEFSDWPTFPQLYVKGEFVGGCDIVKEMYQNGELQTYLTEKGVATQDA